MRSFALSLLSVALLSVGVSAHPHISRNIALAQYNPAANDITARSLTPTPVKREPDNISNAERFARGLPPNSPKRLHDEYERRALPSACPGITKTGRIEVKDRGQSMGYVGKDPINKFGEYGITTTPEDALIIAFEQSSCPNPGVPFDIVATNGLFAAADFKVFGAVVGWQSTDTNLTPGSFNYAYLAGVREPVPAQSPATWQENSFWYATSFVRDSETAIWNYDPSTGSLFPQWTNTDGVKHATHLYWYPGDNSIGITGDLAEFNKKYGYSPAVTFTFIAN